MNLTTQIFDSKTNTINSFYSATNLQQVGWARSFISLQAITMIITKANPSFCTLSSAKYNTQFRPNDRYPYTRSLQLALFFLKCIFLLFSLVFLPHHLQTARAHSTPRFPVDSSPKTMSDPYLRIHQATD